MSSERISGKGYADPNGKDPGTGGWWFKAAPGHGYVQYAWERVWCKTKSGKEFVASDPDKIGLDLHPMQEKGSVWYGGQKNGAMVDPPSLNGYLSPALQARGILQDMNVEQSEDDPIVWVRYRQDFFTFVYQLSPRKLLGHYYWFNEVTIDLSTEAHVRSYILGAPTWVSR